MQSTGRTGSTTRRTAPPPATRGSERTSRAAAEALRSLRCHGGRLDGLLLRRPRLPDAGLAGERRRGDRLLRTPHAGARATSARPIDEAREGLVRVPVLGLYGGADRGIPRADVEAYDQALEAAGVEHRIVVYPDAPHSFFDRTMTEHADACRDAWARVLGFVDSLAR